MYLIFLSYPTLNKFKKMVEVLKWVSDVKQVEKMLAHFFIDYLVWYTKPPLNAL